MPTLNNAATVLDVVRAVNLCFTRDFPRLRTVMINSGSVNGVPVHASKYMLQKQLRDRMGFKGVAVSDWQDMKYLVDRHKVAPDYKTAIAMSVNAGVDMAMEPSNAAEFTSLLLANVRDGSVSRGRIDQAVRRVLKLKFDLGLFEKPYVDPAKADGAVVNADRSLARRAAAEGTVLLKNDGVLPLPTSARKIVVTGETADDVRRQLGGWTVEWQGVPDDSPLPPTATVLTGVREAVPGASVVHAATPAAAVADAADANALSRVVTALCAERPVHVLVNNTAGPPGGPAHAAAPEDYVAVFRQHLVANQMAVLVVELHDAAAGGDLFRRCGAGG